MIFPNLILMLFLILFVQQGSLSSETELSQYFSQDVSSASFLSESTLVASNSDEGLHHRSCTASMEGTVHSYNTDGYFFDLDLFCVLSLLCVLFYFLCYI